MHSSFKNVDYLTSKIFKNQYVTEKIDNKM